MLIRSENISVVFNINHQGGARSLKLPQAAHKLWVWADNHLASLREHTHKQGSRHIVTKCISVRGMATPSGSAIKLEHVADVDQFADSQSTQCPRWFSLSKEAGLLGQDAMAHSWASGPLSAFLPFLMIWLVLSRIRVMRHPLLLIAPCWPNRLWFRLLHHLLTGLIEGCSIGKHKLVVAF